MKIYLLHPMGKWERLSKQDPLYHRIEAGKVPVAEMWFCLGTVETPPEEGRLFGLFTKADGSHEWKELLRDRDLVRAGLSRRLEAAADNELARLLRLREERT